MYYNFRRFFFKIRNCKKPAEVVSKSKFTLYQKHSNNINSSLFLSAKLNFCARLGKKGFFNSQINPLAFQGSRIFGSNLLNKIFQLLTYLFAEFSSCDIQQNIEDICGSSAVILIRYENLRKKYYCRSTI